jgi:outer membrane murein-binding lipoprotein Lpp
MSRILTATIFSLMLAGCASEPGYDRSAVPQATAAARQAAAMCEKEQTPSKFSASKFMACRVAAERNFAMAIHLPKMDAFDTYADKMLALAADYDAGHIGLKQMDRRAASIRSDFLMACNCGLGGHREYNYPSFVNSPIPTTGNLGVQN